MKEEDEMANLREKVGDGDALNRMENGLVDP